MTCSGNKGENFENYIYLQKNYMIFHVFIAIPCKDVQRILIRKSVLTVRYTIRCCTFLLYLPPDRDSSMVKVTVFLDVTW